MNLGNVCSGLRTFLWIDYLVIELSCLTCCIWLSAGRVTQIFQGRNGQFRLKMQLCILFQVLDANKDYNEMKELYEIHRQEILCGCV